MWNSPGELEPRMSPATCRGGLAGPSVGFRGAVSLGCPPRLVTEAHRRGDPSVPRAQQGSPAHCAASFPQSRPPTEPFIVTVSGDEAGRSAGGGVRGWQGARPL